MVTVSSVPIQLVFFFFFVAFFSLISSIKIHIYEIILIGSLRIHIYRLNNIVNYSPRVHRVKDGRACECVSVI